MYHNDQRDVCLDMQWDLCNLPTNCSEFQRMARPCHLPFLQHQPNNPLINNCQPFQPGPAVFFKQNLAAQEGFMHGNLYQTSQFGNVPPQIHGPPHHQPFSYYMQPSQQLLSSQIPPPKVNNLPSIDIQSMNDSSDFSDSIDSGNGTIPNNLNSSQSERINKNEIVTSTPFKSSRLRRRTRNRNSQSHSFSNQYDLITDEDNILGQGAYATVRLAIRKKDNKRFAVKVIDKNNKSNTREKCMNELRQLQRCKGAKNILNMHEFYDTAERYYIVTEYMAGGNLHDRLTEGQEISEYEAASITRDLARALAFLHQNRISHRDIKPQNILCKSMTSLSPVVLSDFDLSCCDDTHGNSSYDHDYGHSTSSSYDSWKSHDNSRDYGYVHRFPMEMDSPVGSPEYMSPEIAKRFLVEDDLLCDKYTEATDIWSLGVLLFKALCGDVPFKALGCEDDECQWEEGQACPDCQTSLWEEIVAADLQFKSKIWSSISNQAKHLVSRCLMYNAEERITAAEILEHPFIKALGNIGENEEEREEIGILSRHINSQLSMDSVPEQDEPMAQTMRFNNPPNQPGSTHQANHQASQQLRATGAPLQVQAARPALHNFNVHAIVNPMQQCTMSECNIQPSDSYKLKQRPAVPTNALAASATARGEMKIATAMIDDIVNSNICGQVLNTKKMTDEEEEIEGLKLEHLEMIFDDLDQATTLKEFLKVLQENPEFQLTADQLAMLDVIENPPDTKLAELLIDQDSGHGIQ